MYSYSKYKVEESWSRSRGVGVYFLIHGGVGVAFYFPIFGGVGAGVYSNIFGKVGVEAGAGVYFMLATP